MRQPAIPPTALPRCHLTNLRNKINQFDTTRIMKCIPLLKIKVHCRFLQISDHFFTSFLSVSAVGCATTLLKKSKKYSRWIKTGRTRWSPSALISLETTLHEVIRVPTQVSFDLRVQKIGRSSVDTFMTMLAAIKTLPPCHGTPTRTSRWPSERGLRHYIILVLTVHRC